MKLSLSYQDFSAYVQSQLDHFFPDNLRLTVAEFQAAYNLALDRTEFCFKHLTLKAYAQNGQTYLNHLHTDQYAVFLWFLSNSVWTLRQNETMANKIFCLNKTLHGLNCMYDTQLPEIFLLLHTFGAVLGKATYGSFFIATQGCTIGAQHGKYPVIGRGVALLPYSAIIGDCRIGDRVSIGIHSVVYQQDIGSDKVVLTKSEGTRLVKDSPNSWTQQFYNITL
jgi:serine O-acetyltransferase